MFLTRGAGTQSPLHHQTLLCGYGAGLEGVVGIVHIDLNAVSVGIAGTFLDPSYQGRRVLIFATSSSGVDDVST